MIPVAKSFPRFVLLTVEVNIFLCISSILDWKDFSCYNSNPRAKKVSACENFRFWSKNTRIHKSMICFFCLWQATVFLPGHYQESMDSAPPRWPPFSPLIPDIGCLVRHFFFTLSQRATCFDKRTKRGETQRAESEDEVKTRQSQTVNMNKIKQKRNIRAIKGDIP